METVIGLKLKDHTILASDSFSYSSILKHRDNNYKVYTLSGNHMMALSAQSDCDRSYFLRYLIANSLFNTNAYGRSLTISELANLAKKTLSDHLRTKFPYATDVLLTGKNEEDFKMFYIDYSGGLTELDYMSTGYAAYFVNSILDTQYKNDLSVEEGIAVIKNCFTALKKRFMVSMDKFYIKTLDKENNINELVCEI